MNIRSIAILVTAFSTVLALASAAPAVARSRGIGATTPEGTKVDTQEGESEAACIKRQMAIVDPVSKIHIQPGDAQRFCSRRSRNRR